MKPNYTVFRLVVFLLFSLNVQSQVFHLPSLSIIYDTLYFKKDVDTTLTCVISPGWSEARMIHVEWIKDGEVISDFKEFFDAFSFKEQNVVILKGAKSTAEGNYQCLATLHDVRLTNRQYVETTLISAPIKFRKARLTKFERSSDHIVDAVINEVARLPCIGMPDVIPGPPEVCFVRDSGKEKRCYGSRSDHSHSRYLSTQTGLQISLVQPHDEGKYFCVVKNSYMNVTKRSPHGVILKLTDKKYGKMDEYIRPALLYPTKINKAIIVDAVAGQDVLLECVFSKSAKVVWTTEDGEITDDNLHDDLRPHRQIWGNLLIRNVSSQNEGDYYCHGLSAVNKESKVESRDHPRAHYKIVVHAPTNVVMRIEPHENSSRTVKISCKADNMVYEVPMLYVNGTPLINRVDELGIVDETNFYTNPVNVTLTVHRNFSGSIQCLSRPAMDEGEIYGTGLEVGRSHNFFIVNSSPKGDYLDLIIQGPSNLTVYAGEVADLPCIVQRAGSKYWKFKCPKCTQATLIKIINTRMRISGSNTLEIENVNQEDEGWYTCVIRDPATGAEGTANAYLNVLPATTTPEPFTTEPFRVQSKDDNITIARLRSFVNRQDVRVMWEIYGSDTARAVIQALKIDVKRINANEWVETVTVESHVPATTLRTLIPNTTYVFRVRAVREDGTIAISEPSPEFFVPMPQGDVRPGAPRIASLEAKSSTQLLIKWNHHAKMKNAQAKDFHIYYIASDEEQSNVKRVSGDFHELLLTGLRPFTEYTVFITAENDAGKSAPSQSHSTRTPEKEKDEEMENGLFDSLFKGIRELSTETQITIVAVIGGIFALVCLLVGCVIFCNIRSRNEKQKKTPNGKFLDTSYRIFNEQKIQKSKMSSNFYSEDPDESSPLKLNSSSFEDNFGGFTLSGEMPQVYGEIRKDPPRNEEMGKQQPPITHDFLHSGPYMNGGGILEAPTARCFSPESGRSREVIVSGLPHQPPPPMQNIMMPNILSGQKIAASYRGADALMFSPVGTASNSVDGSSEPKTRTTCDSPLHAPSDNGGRYGGGSSRNSDVSSSDGARLLTFKHATLSNHTRELPSIFRGV